LNFNIFNSIILAGIVQGLIFTAVVSYSGKYRSQAARWLAALILCFSINNLQYYLQDSGLISSRTLFGYIWLPLQLLSGPLLFFYGFKLIYPDSPIARRWRLLLVPFTLALGVATYAKLAPLFGPVSQTMDRNFMVFLAIVEFTGIILDQFIVIVLLREVKRAGRSIGNFRFESVRPELAWFRTILTVFLAASFVWLGVAIQTFLFDASQVWWHLVWIFMSAMIYWLGHVGLYRYGIHEERKKIRSYLIQKQISYNTSKPKNEHIVAVEKILIGDKRYLDCTFSLEKLSEEMNLSKSHLSRLINQELGIGFNDYLNSLRVDEAKRHLCNPEFEHYTLLAIGLEAGFNSKTTFNTAFKKLTSLTPSEFRKSSAPQCVTQSQQA
jgi:AraC-like DNA-binding protein